MTTAVIYSNGNQECERIAQLLKALPQVSEFLRYDLDKDFSKGIPFVLITILCDFFSFI